MLADSSIPSDGSNEKSELAANLDRNNVNATQSAPTQLREVNVNTALGKDEEPVRLDEGDRLLFAKQVLAGLAIICVGAITAYACNPANSALKEVFELIKIGAFPIVTLVITFYFPNSLKK